MSYYVAVSGLPPNVKKQKMIHFLRSYVFKKPSLQFWIESIKPGSEYNLKEMLIRFETEAGADTAARTLQDYPYQHTDQQIYHLKCWIKTNSTINMNTEGLAEDIKIEREIKSIDFQRPYSPKRERSPHLQEELTKLELEIELTNKKRMLLEAERNLILEQKRLEMLQKTGTSDVSFEESTQSTPAPILYPPIKLPTKQERRRLRGRIPTSRDPMDLYWPSKMVTRDMLPLIKRHIDADQLPLFISLMRNVVKKRMSDYVGDNPNGNAKKYLSMYRMLYPKNMDEDFIAKLKHMMLQFNAPPDLLQPGTSNANMTNNSINSIDPADLPISELSKDLDDWIEDAGTSQS